MAEKKKKERKRPSYLAAVVQSGGEPQKPKYRREDFIHPTSDAKGHSSPVGFRCMNGYLRTIDVFVSSRKFPYETASDLLRHALHEHLHWLSDLEPKIPVRLNILDAALELARAQQQLIKYQNTVREISVTVEELNRSGMSGQARKLVKQIMIKIDEDPVEDEWKDRLKKEIGAKYGYLFPDGVIIE